MHHFIHQRNSIDFAYLYVINVIKDMLLIIYIFNMQPGSINFISI